MNVLVIGGGGREHALAWKLAQSSRVERVYVAPGNAGTAAEQGIDNVAIDASDIAGLIDFAKEHAVALTVVGPEAPLVAGVVDEFDGAGLKCFGPTSRAARLEGSKTFAKEFLVRHNIPTARYRSFTDSSAALGYADSLGYPLVVKADGLAAGKGVEICADSKQADQVISAMLNEDRFGSAGRTIVVEEFLAGEEASFICLVDGKNILPMATSQDHKAAHDGDSGPNTGGMGAYSPAPVVDDELHRRIMERVIEPTVRGLESEGMPYTGFLYAGLMIDEDRIPKVLEFNCRFGDPETQPIMMRLKSDLAAHCLAALDGRLDTETAEWDARPALGVVMAADGYPGSYDKGRPIDGLDDIAQSDVKIFHAGTQVADDAVVTAGGRVLCATALGQTIGEAQLRAYDAARRITWEGCWYRSDIGHRAIE